MTKSKYADRIKKLEETGELMDHMLATPKVDLAMEERVAIDIGVSAGFTIAKAVAEGKCDDMSPEEIAMRLFDMAFGMYIEGAVLSDTLIKGLMSDLEDLAAVQPESEAKHAED